jgi:glycosyltransferase involved in cell wall biosynthesis
MLSSTTQFSIIIPAFNAEKTLKPCLDHIRKSTFRDYEIIVVDDGSIDETVRLAESLADHVVVHTKNQGIMQARSSGSKIAKFNFLVFIDQDILVQPDSLQKIHTFLQKNPTVDAFTGLLSKKHPNADFFSQYKNLYMNYIFKKLPDEITFVYGSIFGLKKELMGVYDTTLKIVQDTAIGQSLANQGKKVVFMRNLKVIHMKKHTFFSWIKNDFLVPYEWAHIFLRYQGWKQLGRRKTGFAHSPKEQLLCVILAPMTLNFLFFVSLVPMLAWGAMVTFGLWLLLSVRFLWFLTKERGLIFGIKSLFVTFLDNMVMAIGILCGFLRSMLFRS